MSRPGIFIKGPISASFPSLDSSYSSPLHSCSPLWCNCRHTCSLSSTLNCEMSPTALRINTNDSFVVSRQKKQIPIWNEAEGWLEVNVRGKLWKIIWRSLAVKVVDWHLSWSWAITWTLLTGKAGQPLKSLSSWRAIKPRRSSKLHRCAEEGSSKPTGNGYFQPLVFGVQCDGDDCENSRRH